MILRGLALITLLFTFTAVSIPTSAEAVRLPRRYKIGLSIGQTWTNYSELYQFQPGLLIPDLKQRSILGTLSLTYYLVPEVIDVNAEGYLTLATLAKSGANDDLRFYGLNFRVGYVIPLNYETWRLVLFGGWYHANTLVLGGGYGYKNLYGPQFYPQLEYAPYVEERRFTYGVYAKISPVTDGLTGYDFKNRELGAGINFKVPIGKLIYPIDSYTTLLVLSLGWSHLNFEHFNVRVVTISQNNLTAGIGLQF